MWNRIWCQGRIWICTLIYVLKDIYQFSVPKDFAESDCFTIQEHTTLLPNLTVTTVGPEKERKKSYHLFEKQMHKWSYIYAPDIGI